MCVIIQIENWNEKLVEDIQIAAIANPDGIGIAYLSRGKLYFEKTAKTQNLLPQILKQQPTPCVLHFRLATYKIKSELNHPFSLKPYNPNKRRGLSEKLLFHNGHLSISGYAYQSDSQLFAHLAYSLGTDILREFSQNFLIIEKPWKIIRIGQFFRCSYGYTTQSPIRFTYPSI